NMPHVLAFAQIVHYGRTDLAVSLRVLRAVGDVATVTKNPHYLGVLGAWAEAVAADCVAHLPSTAHAQVRSRLASVLGRAAVAR
ncbi:MAG: hypothetical protein M3O46_20635, partial [Myxococcota bacterium]|nr:hypothetical protein [Myxococcota bacterium]